MRHLPSLALVAAACILFWTPVHADEGMWTFDDFPQARAEQALGIRLDRPWLDHLQAATVRLTSGCSGAAVSHQGLVLTNQHCVLGCAQSLSTQQNDYVQDGFLTRGKGEERNCPGVQAEILNQITDITNPVFDASAGKIGDAFVVARQSVFNSFERSLCGGDPRYRCQVIGFFGGGQFKIYKYRVYRDVRLAFAPEYAIGFFGGDPDNFSFPRYALDGAFLRLYEDGMPAILPDWLTWSTAAPKAGQPVFVSGSPGATDRALTVAQLETQRDIAIPISIAQHVALRARLAAFAAQGAQQQRIVAEAMFVQDNDLKLIRGRSEALDSAPFMEARRGEETALRARVTVDAKLAAQIGDPWAEITALQKDYADQFIVWRQIESGAGGGSRLFSYARQIVRGVTERVKPSPQRLPEFADARLSLTRKALLDDQVTYPELEALYLRTWLEETQKGLGPGTLVTAAMLGGKTPLALAKRLIAGTGLADPAYRQALWDGGPAGLAASTDPMIVYVRSTDPLSRAARDVWENQIIGPTDRASLRIAQVRFVTKGGVLYPDATYSPRLSYGRVMGWTEGQAAVGPFTSIEGMFGHAGAQEPFRLPPDWLSARASLSSGTVLNFVTTNDITGGNSGSPIVDAKGRIIGAAFDGNLASIAGDFVYDGAANRTVAVSTAAIIEALKKVYHRDDLVAELEGR